MDINRFLWAHGTLGLARKDVASLQITEVPRFLRSLLLVFPAQPMYTRTHHFLTGGLVCILGLLLLAPAAQAQSMSPDKPGSSANPSANVKIGAPAPNFTLTDTNGDTHSLSEYEGTFVVLEWLDFRCPYVRKHYGSGNMQRLQTEYTNKDVVWLSIYSASPSHRAYVPPKKMAAKNQELGGSQTAILLDPSGEVGKTYNATNTPHMFVISPEGKLLYKGGIDDKPTTDEADVKTATNYVRKALDAAMSGDEVSPKQAKPYGCPIKYGS